MLENPKHEKFCQLLVTTSNKSEAYRGSHPNSAKWKDASVHNKASALSKKKSIIDRVDSISAGIMKDISSGFIDEMDRLKDEIKCLKAQVGVLGGEYRRRRAPSKSNRYLIMHRAGFKCQCCGSKPAVENDVTLEIDHIIPYSKGGGDDPGNLQVLCSTCNIAKSNHFEFNHNE